MNRTEAKITAVTCYGIAGSLFGIPFVIGVYSFAILGIHEAALAYAAMLFGVLSVGCLYTGAFCAMQESRRNSIRRYRARRTN